MYRKGKQANLFRFIETYAKRKRRFCHHLHTQCIFTKKINIFLFLYLMLVPLPVHSFFYFIISYFFHTMVQYHNDFFLKQAILTFFPQSLLEIHSSHLASYLVDVWLEIVADLAAPIHFSMILLNSFSEKEWRARDLNCGPPVQQLAP